MPDKNLHNILLTGATGYIGRRLEDVVNYLEKSITLEETSENHLVDIGSSAMSFREMLLAAAEVMGLKRYIMPVPILSPKFSWRANLTVYL